MYELKNPIETTLVQYINGILKNFKERTRKSKSNSKKVKEDKEENQKTTFDNNNLNLFDMNEKNINSKPIDKVKIMFENLSSEEKLKVEKEAVKMCAATENIEEVFIYGIKRTSPNIYFNTIRKYIENILKNS